MIFKFLKSLFKRHVKYPKYVIKKTKSNKYYWNLYAINGQCILTSEMYTTKQNAKHGINSSKNNNADISFVFKIAKSKLVYFVQKGLNGEIIGTSEMYSTNVNAVNGITAVKEYGSIANVEDLT